VLQFTHKLRLSSVRGTSLQLFRGSESLRCTRAAVLSANTSSYLDNPLVGSEDGIQLHLGTSLLQEQHFVGFGGHRVAAGTTGQCLGRGGQARTALQERTNLQRQRMWKEINFS